MCACPEVGRQGNDHRRSKGQGCRRLGFMEIDPWQFPIKAVSKTVILTAGEANFGKPVTVQPITVSASSDKAIQAW